MIVVGAGPVGLALALGLSRRGFDVLVLEKECGTAEHSRAPAIWSRTQEILARLGVLEAFEREGILVPRIEMWDADFRRVLWRLPVEELRDETDYARLLIIPQSRTEHLLCEALQATDKGNVRFSSEVVDIMQDASGVEVQYRSGRDVRDVRATFVAGCDGAGSTVRDYLGASFDGITYTMRAALADVVPDVAEDLRFPRMTTRPDLAIGIRIGQRLWRLILPFRESDQGRTLGARVESAVNHLFGGAPYETVWESEFELHNRVSSRWAGGRVVLAGDAAHLNSPVGGQGMNAGMIDADALTGALVDALRQDDAAPLAAYERQRREAVQRGVNRLTDGMTRLLLTGRGSLLRPMLMLVDLALRIRPLRRRLLRRMAMLR